MYLLTSMSAEAQTETNTGGLAGWLLQAFRGLKTPGQRPARKHMRVVETLTLGPRKQLVLVSCDGERFLIGTGADNIGTITRVRPEAASFAAEASAR